MEAGIYTRISRDPTGEGLGVERQHDLAEKLCAARGWTVAEVYSDNDISAFSGKDRPGYRRLLHDVAAGRLGAVVAYQQSRLWRSRRERVEAIELFKTAKIPIAMVRGSDLDLSTAYGRSMAGLLGEFDTMESEIKSERLIDARAQAAEKGKAPQGSAGYGYRYDGTGKDRKLVVVEAQAEVIRECAEAVLTGKPISSICRELNVRKVPSPSGRALWRSASLIMVLVSARISGRREYIPMSLRTTTSVARPWTGEITAVDCWSAIISVADSDALRMLLTDPARRTHTYSTIRKYLLSGLMVCAGCGTKMVGQIKKDPAPNVYKCAAYTTTRGGGHVSINMDYAENLICEAVIDGLGSAHAIARAHHTEAPAENLHALIRSDETMLADFSALYANREITRGEWETARPIIKKRCKDNRAKLDAAQERNALVAFAGQPEQEMRDLWARSGPADRRAVIAAMFEKITVHPYGAARAVGGRFSADDEERFEFVMRM